MKKIIFLICVVTAVSVVIVIQAIRGSSANFAIEQTLTASKQSNTCGDGVERSALLSDSPVPVVRFLAEAEKVCDSRVTNTVWYSVSLPNTIEGLSAVAIKTTADLRAIADLGLTPIVIIDLNKTWKYEDFQNVDKAAYAQFFETFFTQLKENGIESNMVHRWIILPEPNQPKWDSSYLEPELFARMHGHISEKLLAAYPDSKTHLVFNMMTFEQKDFSWSQKEYVSVAPYLQKVQSPNIVGMQFIGFMFLPPATEDGEMLLDPNEFVAQALIAEALEVKPVAELGLITGTFASAYAGSQKTEVIIPAKVRHEILSQTIDTFLKFKKNNPSLELSITLSSTNLSQDPNSDWWYLNTDKTLNQEHSEALVQFLSKAYKNDIVLVLK